MYPTPVLILEFVLSLDLEGTSATVLALPGMVTGVLRVSTLQYKWTEYSEDNEYTVIAENIPCFVTECPPVLGGNAFGILDKLTPLECQMGKK